MEKEKYDIKKEGVKKDEMDDVEKHKVWADVVEIAWAIMEKRAQQEDMEPALSTYEGEGYGYIFEVQEPMQMQKMISDQ